MWPDIRGLFGSYASFRLPDVFTPHGSPHQKRSRNHIGDYTPPKAKVSKHRKFIKKMARV